MLGTSKRTWGFDPRSIPGCILWLDAADSSTLTGSNPVTAWKDKSSNAYSFTGTGAVVSNYPSNSTPSLYFNGSSYLVNTSLSVAPPYSFFVVAHSTSTPASYARALNALTTAGTDFFLFIGAYNSNSLLSYGTGGGWTDLSGYGNPTSNMWHLMVASVPASTPNSTRYLNGSAYSSVGVAGCNAASFTSINVGGGYGTYTYATQSWNGYIGEIIAYNFQVSEAQRQAVEGYLAFKWNLTGPLVTTCAGSGTAGFADGTGTAAQFSGAFYIAKDSNDNLYVADGNNNRIRKVVPSTGVVTTFAGNGTGSSTDGTGTGATIYSSIAITSDYSNYLYITDNGPYGGGYGAIRRISIPGGVVTTLYTTTSSSFLQYPQAIAINRAILPTVNLYICDTYNHCIRMWSGQTSGQTIPVVAGVSGATGQSDGTGSAARFLYPGGIEIDSTGSNAWICGANGCRIMKMTIPGYVVTTVAGSTSSAINTRKDGPPGVALTSYPRGPVISLDGKRVYWTDTAGAPTANNVRYYDIERNYTYTIAGTTVGTAGGTNGVGLNTSFYGPIGLAITSDGLMYIPEQSGNRLRRLNLNPYCFSNTHLYSRMMPFSTQFNPTDISNCAVWFDGGDYDSLEFSGSSINKWNDKSGNGYHATIYSGRIGATWSTASNCVYFQASNVGYQTSYPANPTTETMFIVANVDSPASINNNTIIGGQYGARSFGFGYAGGAGGTGYSSYLNNEVAWQSSSIAGPSAGVTAMITGNVNSLGNVSCGLNGSNLTSGTISNWLNTTTTLGVDTTTSIYYFKGYVMEIIFYSTVLSTQERRMVEGYLTNKWNLQPSLITTHPFKYVVATAPVSFIPTNITNCALWLDAGGISTNNFLFSNATSNVATWLDKSGNNRNLIVGSGTPTYSSNAVTLAGSYMYVTSAVDMTAVTCFIVAKTNSTADNQTVFGIRPNTSYVYGSSDGFGFYMDGTTGPQIRIYGSSGVAITATVSSPQIYSFVGSTTTINAWINGVSQTGLSGQTTRTSTAQGFAIGGEWQISTYGNFTTYASIYEIVVYSTVLTTQQRQKVEGYLRDKWASTMSSRLPTAHPYKFAPPASVYSVSTVPVSYSNFLWTKFYNITSDPSINGPGSSGWGAQIGTAGAYDPINFQDADSRIGQSDYVGVVSKGFMYSATTTVVTFYTVSDDGIVLYFNGSQVINNWTYHGDTGNYSSSVTLPAGYTPIELRFFEWGGGFTCELYWSVGSTGSYTAAGTGVMYYNATNL